VKNKLLIATVFGLATLASCAAHRVRDYTFGVMGTVSAEDGTALQDVEVVLNVDPPVYEGVTPVKTQRIVASKGAFVFRCLSGSASTRYSVTFRKDGYETQTISGAAPPDGNYTIRLRKASTEGGGRTKASSAN
jgi:hypothetical protein